MSAIGGRVDRFDATTMMLRPGSPSGYTTDLWDEVLRASRQTRTDTTRSLVRRWSHWAVPAAATALIAATGLGRPGLWTDELATWGMATTPWSQFWWVLRFVDAVLAPYYVLMHVWVSVLGDSDLALRAPSLLAMVASAGLIGVLGARLAGRTPGLLAGLVFAVLPSTSRYAAEARPFALTVLAACVATWLLLRAWDRPGLLRWTAYGLAVAVLGWLHMVAVLLVASHTWVTAAWRRELWWRLAIAAGAGVIAVAPILLYGVRQRHQVAYIPPVSVYTAIPYAQVVFGGVGLAVLVALLGLFGLPLRFPSAVFTGWAVVPPLALIAVSAVLPMFLPRYLVYTTPGWALLAGVALARLPVPWVVVAMVAIAGLGVPAQVSMRTAGGHEQATHQLARRTRRARTARRRRRVRRRRTDRGLDRARRRRALRAGGPAAGRPARHQPAATCRAAAGHRVHRRRTLPRRRATGVGDPARCPRRSAGRYGTGQGERVPRRVPGRGGVASDRTDPGPAAAKGVMTCEPGSGGTASPPGGTTWDRPPRPGPCSRRTGSSGCGSVRSSQSASGSS
jgi:mannosyltransferase